MRMCVTGAAGHIGRLVTPALQAAGHDLILIDRENDAEVIGIDLGVWSERLSSLLDGVDTVVHLAGVAQPWASWNEVVAGNIDGTLNLCEAASQAGVKRLVFASSNWVLAGHRATDTTLDASAPPAPVNAYGASKLFGERVLQHHCEAHGMEGVSLRIGYSQHRPDDAPGPHMAQGLWGQRMWLSRRDLVAILTLAATAPLPVRYAVVNAVSRNGGMAWDLEAARSFLGYEPQDSSEPRVSPELEQQELSARDARNAVDSIERLLTVRRW